MVNIHLFNYFRFMLPIETELSILIHLAKADGFISHEELEIIQRLGLENNLSTEQVNDLVENENSIAVFQNLSLDDRIELLISMIKLMKRDNKIHQKEINFCQKIALQLGFGTGVIAKLSAYIFASDQINTDPDVLIKMATKFYSENN